MSRKLFAFLLSELKTVRIICKNCNVITELPIADLADKFKAPKCPSCKNSIASENENPFVLLARSLAWFAGENRVDVEFIIPDDGKSE